MKTVFNPPASPRPHRGGVHDKDRCPMPDVIIRPMDIEKDAEGVAAMFNASD